VGAQQNRAPGGPHRGVVGSPGAPAGPAGEPPPPPPAPFSDPGSVTGMFTPTDPPAQRLGRVSCHNHCQKHLLGFDDESSSVKETQQCVASAGLRGRRGLFLLLRATVTTALLPIVGLSIPFINEDTPRLAQFLNGSFSFLFDLPFVLVFTLSLVNKNEHRCLGLAMIPSRCSRSLPTGRRQLRCTCKWTQVSRDEHVTLQLEMPAAMGTCCTGPSGLVVWPTWRPTWWSPNREVAVL